MEVGGKLQRGACRLVVHVMQKVGSLDESTVAVCMEATGGGCVTGCPRLRA
jgi:hypothetical protein